MPGYDYGSRICKYDVYNNEVYWFCISSTTGLLNFFTPTRAVRIYSAPTLFFFSKTTMLCLQEHNLNDEERKITLLSALIHI